jgi:hypothetical protein
MANGEAQLSQVLSGGGWVVLTGTVIRRERMIERPWTR